MGLLYTETPSGERRRWTLKEIVQGKPLGHPSHAMVVHFPVAFYIGALGLDIVSRVGHFAQAPLAAADPRGIRGIAVCRTDRPCRLVGDEAGFAHA